MRNQPGHRKISPNSVFNNKSLPFTFPSMSDKTIPQKKICISITADRHLPCIDTSISSPKNQNDSRTSPTGSFDSASQLRPHTTKYTQKHFDMNARSSLSWGELKLPVNPSKVIKLFPQLLPDWEKEEIIKYTSVYYISQKGKSNDHVLDDPAGYLNVSIHDHISFRYEIVKILGQGSFGQVVEVYDHATQRSLAMKIIKNHREYLEQALEEIKILRILKENDRSLQSNIVHLEENFMFRNHMCITFELLSINLYDLMKKNQFRGVSETMIKRFSIQILNALSFIKRFKIIHSDLKPENILLVHISRSSLKVIDFGSSSFESNRIQTYIQSRFYRAPEVILGLPLTTAIDMWSFGCILAELITGNPLFAGEDEKDQLSCMMEILGPPPAELVQIASKRNYYFDKDYNPYEIVNSRGRKRNFKARELRTVLKGTDEGLISLIEQCIVWSPAMRITPEAALRNPWLYENVHRPNSARYSSFSRSGGKIQLEVTELDFRKNKASYS